MKPRRKRLLIVVGALASISVAAALVLNALNSNVAFFFTPTQDYMPPEAQHALDAAHGKVKQ